MLTINDFDYILPEERIAQTPLYPRDSSRLLVYRRKEDRVEHKIFRDIVDYLQPGDVLVVNNTKVLPARIFARTPHGGAVELLLLKRLDKDEWEVMVKPGKKARPGATLTVNEELSVAVQEVLDEGLRRVRFAYDGVFEDILSRVGTMPLPPYIREKLDDQTRYQTVYGKINGSAAAPTAGLHFTPDLLETIKQKGVTVTQVLLHVGLGTFRPVKAERIEEHEMHAEFFHIEKEVADEINRRRANGGRIIAVGTTATRVLESASLPDGTVLPMAAETAIFIYPGYKFKATDALITNFHLPESTLIMLISALAGKENVMNAYKTAVEERYRFFSFGDAMLIV